MTLSDTEWDDDAPTAPALPVIDQELLLAAARKRLQARLNKAADAQIAAILDGAEPSPDSIEVPGMADAVATALRELETGQEDPAQPAAAETTPPGDDEPKLHYETLPDFVAHFLIKSYRRHIPAKNAWCKEWWKHPEATMRLSALWRAWETLRLEPGTGMSVWWRDHADHHMAKLLASDGPFKGCTANEHGENGKLEPLPWASPPPELYDALTYKA